MKPGDKLLFCCVCNSTILFTVFFSIILWGDHFPEFFKTGPNPNLFYSFFFMVFLNLLEFCTVHLGIPIFGVTFYDQDNKDRVEYTSEEYKNFSKLMLNNQSVQIMLIFLITIRTILMINIA